MKVSSISQHWRFYTVIIILLLVLIRLSYEVLRLQILEQDFLKDQGSARSLRHIEIPAQRGTISDRNGYLLALNSPVISIWGDVSQMQSSKRSWKKLAKALGKNSSDFIDYLKEKSTKKFVYLSRGLSLEKSKLVLNLNIPGVHGIKEFKRFYPAGDITSHVVGLTDIDNKGREGIELAYNESLSGVAGKSEVIKDLRGNLIEDIKVTKHAKAGKKIVLSLDIRLQHLAYLELHRAVIDNAAKAGSLVVLDIKNGDILAMVNQPSYDPNNRYNLDPIAVRNRALIDVFEPGSTVKPISMSAALESGKWKLTDKVNVYPGTLKVGKYIIQDVSHIDRGPLDLAGILINSSNVGMSKIAFDIGGKSIFDQMVKLGFAQDTGLGFPGERLGRLPISRKWEKPETATLSYGYGLSVTAVQLAHAFSVLANNGKMTTLNLVHDEQMSESKQVVSKKVSKDIQYLLQEVIENPKGIWRARVAGYHVAGKSGTVHKVYNPLEGTQSGYKKNSYYSIFAGFGPMSDPKYAVVIVLDEPSKGKYFGGLVSAPVFSRVMSGIFRIMNIMPDNTPIHSSNLARKSQSWSQN